AIPDRSKPYLLLLIRPDAVPTYYRLMGMLRRLPIDYGYELVDADWTLDFSATRPDTVQLDRQQIALQDTRLRSAANPSISSGPSGSAVAGPVAMANASPPPTRIPGPKGAPAGALTNPDALGGPSSATSRIGIAQSQNAAAGDPEFTFGRLRFSPAGATGMTGSLSGESTSGITGTRTWTPQPSVGGPERVKTE